MEKFDNQFQKFENFQKTSFFILKRKIIILIKEIDHDS